MIAKQWASEFLIAVGQCANQLTIQDCTGSLSHIHIKKNPRNNFLQNDIKKKFQKTLEMVCRYLPIFRFYYQNFPWGIQELP